MTDRVWFDEAPPIEAGWYGIISTDGDGEVWVSAAWWDGQWERGTECAYVRSAAPFGTKEAAQAWAYAQPD